MAEERGMDRQIRQLERQLAANEADDLGAARLIHLCARAGRIPEARAVLAQRLRGRRIDGALLEAARYLGIAGGALDVPGPRPRARANVGILFPAGGAAHGDFVQIFPAIAYAGVPGAGSLVSALALHQTFGDAVQETRWFRIDGQAIVDFRVALAAPWIIGDCFAVSSLRILTLPAAAHTSKLRRLLLRTPVSAIAFVVDDLSDGNGLTNEAAFSSLVRDFRTIYGFGLVDLPLVLQYQGAVDLAWHKALSVALGVRAVPMATARIETTAEAEPLSPRFAAFSPSRHEIDSHTGVLETFSDLLFETARGLVEIVAPRPRLRSRSRRAVS